MVQLALLLYGFDTAVVPIQPSAKTKGSEGLVNRVTKHKPYRDLVGSLSPSLRKGKGKR